MKNLYSSLSFIVFMLVMPGCFGGANHRDFYKDNVELNGIMNGANGTDRLEYINIEIDMSKQPNELTKKLGVEFSPGTITPLEDIDEKLLADFVKPMPVPDMMSGKPIEGQRSYLFNGYAIHVSNGKPISLGLGNNIHAILWDIPRHKRYVMPFTEKDALELFGEPDRIRDTFQF